MTNNNQLIWEELTHLYANIGSPSQINIALPIVKITPNQLKIELPDKSTININRKDLEDDTSTTFAPTGKPKNVSREIRVSTLHTPSNMFPLDTTEIEITVFKPKGIIFTTFE